MARAGVVSATARRAQGDTGMRHRAHTECNQSSPYEKRHEVRPKPIYDCIKRLFDILVALLCFTVGIPVYIVIAVIIMTDDFGNPFFIQERVGLGGRRFPMVKYRTMYVGSDDCKYDLMEKNEYSSVHFKLTDDPRVTRVGKILRRTYLDEIPQAINLLIGSMTVIGPRPFIPSEQKSLPDDRLRVKPGLSCYWQITDTTKMSYEDQLELDYKYIRERGFLTDLKIIWLTIKYILAGRNC